MERVNTVSLWKSYEKLSTERINLCVSIKMEIKVNILLLLAIVTGGVIGARTGVVEWNTNLNESASSILDYVTQQYNSFHPGSDKDIVLILGSIDSKEGTVASLITGNAKNIESVEINGNFEIVRLGEYRRHRDELFNPDRIIPFRLKEAATGAAFYVCPSFETSRSKAEDLAWSLAVRKLLHTARSVKFVFTHSYPIARNDDDWNYDNFVELVEFATKLIENIDRYRMAIALVVTNVPNDSDDNSDDGIAAEKISMFLQDVAEKTLKYKLKRSRKIVERVEIERQLDFINVLLEKEDDQYKRIGILRTIEDDGYPKDITMAERKAILKIVKNNLKYIDIESSDFGYSVTEKSENIVGDMIKKLNKEFNEDFAALRKDIEKFILHKEEQTYKNLTESIHMVNMIEQQLSQIESLEPKSFERQLARTLNTLGIQPSTESMNIVMKYLEFVHFLQKFSTTNLKIPFRILEQITQQRIYLKSLESWYHYMEDVNDDLSQYHIQKNRSQYDGRSLLEEAIERSPVNELDSDLTLNIASDGYPIFTKIIKFNRFNFLQLRGILRQSMQSPVMNCSADGKHLIVTGYNVLISDVLEANCWQTANKVEISALNNIILDSNITKHSTYLSIIAPKCKIHLEDDESSRRIVLDGKIDGKIDGKELNNALSPQFFGICEEICNGKLDFHVSNCDDR